MFFSVEDDRCAVCHVSFVRHQEILRQFGSIRIRFVVPKEPLVARWATFDQLHLTEPIAVEYRECRKFVPVMQIFDKNGNLVLG